MSVCLSVCVCEAQNCPLNWIFVAQNCPTVWIPTSCVSRQNETKQTRQKLYSFGGFLLSRQPLMSCLSLCPSRSHVLTSGTKPIICKPAICLLGFYVVSCNYSTPSPKILSRSFAENLFLKKTKKGGMGQWRHQQRGGPGGHPPRHSHVPRTTITSKSPREAVFITNPPKLQIPNANT